MINYRMTFISNLRHQEKEIAITTNTLAESAYWRV